MALDEFYRQHPGQAVLAEKFQAVVRAKGRKLAEGKQSEIVRIAFIYPGKQVSDYWRRSISSFKKRMDEIGVRYEINEYFSKVRDIRLQETQLRKALEQDPDYLVYTLDVSRHRRLIARVVSKGRPKLILQNITTPLRDWQNKQPFLYVGFDHVTGTILLAERIIQHLGQQKGGYAMLYYTPGYVSAMRGDTFIELMTAGSSLRLAASYYTDGRRSKAVAAALEALADPQIKLLYACSTDVAFGAIDALRTLNKSGEVMVNGWGGGGDELQSILDGEMDLTVMRINDDNGVAMAEAIRFDIEKDVLGTDKDGNPVTKN